MSDLADTIQQKVKLSELHPCPIEVQIHTAKKINLISETAKSNPKLIPYIDVAVFDNKKYVVDGSARVLGLKNASIKEFTANLRHVNSIDEIIVLHVRLNQHSSVNPLKILKLMDFFENKDVEEICKICWLNESYQHMLKNCKNFAKEAADKLQDIVDSLAKILNEFYLPPYVIETICKIEDQTRHMQAVDMLDVLIQQETKNSKFSFPNHEYLVDFLGFLRDPLQRELIEINEENKENKTGSSKQTKPYSVNTNHSEAEKEKFNQIIGNAAHQTILDVTVGDEVAKQLSADLNSFKNIVDNLPKPLKASLYKKIDEIKNNSKRCMFRIDMKKNSIAPVTEKNGIVLVQGDVGKQMVSLSPECVEFLDVSGSEVYVKMITKPEQLAKLAEKLESKDGLRIVILSSNHKV